MGVQQAGVQIGDRIVGIDGNNVTTSTRKEIVSLLRKATDQLRLVLVREALPSGGVRQQRQITHSRVHECETKRFSNPVPLMFTLSLIQLHRARGRALAVAIEPSRTPMDARVSRDTAAVASEPMGSLSAILELPSTKSPAAVAAVHAATPPGGGHERVAVEASE